MQRSCFVYIAVDNLKQRSFLQSDFFNNDVAFYNLHTIILIINDFS